MWYLQRTDEFKTKFPEIAAVKEAKDEEESTFSIRFKRPTSSE